MLEAKKGQIVKIAHPKSGFVEGIIYDVTKSAVVVYYANYYKYAMSLLKDLNTLKVDVYTDYGLKTMYSTLISNDVDKNMVTLENTKAVEYNQKREYVRAAKEFEFQIKVGDEFIKVLGKDISAGGIRFSAQNTSFEDGEILTIVLSAQEFKKDLTIEAQIINNIGGDYILKYTKINEFDRDKIAGFINKTHTS